MKKLSLVVIVGALLLMFWSLTQDRSAEVKVIPGKARGSSSSSERKPTGATSTSKSAAKRISALSQPLATSDLTPKEKDSVESMMNAIALPLSGGRKLSHLVALLKRSGQRPHVTHDQNPYTGEMAIVRTETPSQGTRYFHAQYFTDEKGAPFLQHASFEIRPTPDAMTTAEDTVRHTFKSLTRASQKTPDFIEWNLDETHVVWIKKMAAEDLKDNPFNAYTDQDIGTVRVAIESRIHEDDEK